jgi:hypothetical protein
MEELDVFHADLKTQVEHCYTMIKTFEKELERIRKEECKHPQTEKVNYMWAPGHIEPNTSVCTVCGEIIVPIWENYIIQLGDCTAATELIELDDSEV